MAQTRDTQRSKVAAAENSLGPQRQYVLSDINEWVGKLSRSRFWGELLKEEPTRRKVSVVPAGSGCGDHAVFSRNMNRNVIGLGQNRWTHLHVLHALAHYVQPPKTKPHGPEFAGAYLKLVGRFLSNDAPAFRSALRANRVKTYTWSAEARAAASERVIRKRFQTAKADAQSLIERLEAEKEDDS